MIPFLFLYTLSGASGLTFEIVWARQLATVIGATTHAITAVVAIFMAGLAVGSAIGARLAHRFSRPLAVYGVVELAISIVGFSLSSWLPALEGLTPAYARNALALACLFLPSALMGLTFPLVVESVASAGADRPAGAGLVYGLNTVGAAFGCLAAGYLGVGLLGLRDTAITAAASNFLCGCGALILAFGGPSFLFPARSGKPTRGTPPLSRPPSPAGPPGPSEAALHRPVLLLVPFACGAVGLAVEVLWTRALIPYLNSSTYAFTAILTVFLLAQGTGAMCAWHYLRIPTPIRPATALMIVQLLLSLTIALSPHLMDLVEHVFDGYVGVRRVMSLEQWLTTVAGVFLRTAAVIGLPSLLMGASFPLCVRLLPEESRSGRGAGIVSAANTCGGIVGSLSAGFVLLPTIGVIAGLQTCATTCLCIAILLAIGSGTASLRTDRVRVPALLVGMLVLGVLLISQGHVPFVGRLAARHDLVLLDEGPQDTTAVVDVAGTSGRMQRLIYSNGISYTGDNPPSQRYMRLLGHLPALLADDPANSLVICVGTGMTAAALARHPEVQSLDLVDISPVVARTLPLFTHVNDHIQADPRVIIHRADGRQFTGQTTRTYGVVTLEPPPPRAAGAASLYTVEMYQRARRAMRPGGVIAQWLPLHGLTDMELRLLTRTFLSVFPDAALFMLNENEAALLGSPAPLVVDASRLVSRLSASRVQQSLRGIGFTGADAESLAAEVLALAPLSGPELAAFVGAGPLVTDDRPLVESFATTMWGRHPKETDTGEVSTLPSAAASTEAEPGRAIFVQRLLGTAWRPLAVRGSMPDPLPHHQRMRRELSR